MPASIGAARFVLGGQRSGKSRWAEQQAAAWLAAAPAHHATLIATALDGVGDPQMDARIARHRADRAVRVPRLACIEAPRELPERVARLSRPEHLVLIDCLGLWLTNAMLPADGRAPSSAADIEAAGLRLAQAIIDRAGPVVIVSNEIGLGVVPLGRETRDFVDALGRLNQVVAAACDEVVLMVAGLPMWIKRAPQ